MIVETIVTGYCLLGTMANKQQVHNHSIACPRNIKSGTEIIIQNKSYYCHDVMSKRYPQRFDIWFSDCSVAKNWGVKKLKVKICKK